MRHRWTLGVLCYGLVVGSCVGYLVTEGPFVTARRAGVMLQLGWDNFRLRQEVAELTAELSSLREENSALDECNIVVEADRAELRLALSNQWAANLALAYHLERLEIAASATTSWCQVELVWHQTRLAPRIIVLSDGRVLKFCYSPQIFTWPFPEPARFLPAN